MTTSSVQERRSRQSPFLHCLTCRVGAIELAIEARHVQEVLRAPTVTPVPLAPRIVAGLLPLRGALKTAIDLRLALYADKPVSSHAAFQIVLGPQHEGISLLVDSIGDVQSIDDRCFAALPEALAPHLHGILTGVLRQTQQLLLLLDIDRLLAYSNAQSLTAH